MVTSKVCLLSWLLSISCPLWWKVFSIVSKFLSQIVHLIIISKHYSLWLVQETIPTIQQYINLRLILIIHVLSQISINNSILTISHHGNELRIVRFITIISLIWRKTWPKGKTLFNLSVLSSFQFWTDLNVEEKTVEWIRLFHIA